MNLFAESSFTPEIATILVWAAGIVIIGLVGYTAYRSFLSNVRQEANPVLARKSAYSTIWLTVGLMFVLCVATWIFRAEIFNGLLGLGDA